MTTRTFTLLDLRDELELRERDLADRPGATRIEGVARARRWLDLDGDKALLADAADRRRRAITANDTGGAAAWAHVGGLLHLAGDDTGARPALERAFAYDGVEALPALDRAAARYLLGDLEQAMRLADGLPHGAVAQAAMTQDPAAIERPRAELVWAAVVGVGRPDLDGRGTPLSAWDWVEASFLLEARLRGQAAPTHREMLQACGVVRDGPPPSPEPRADLVAGAAVVLDDYLMLAIADEETVGLVLAPDLHVILCRDGDGWGAKQTISPLSSGVWLLDPFEPTFEHAAERVADLSALAGRHDVAASVKTLVEAYERREASPRKRRWLRR